MERKVFLEGILREFTWLVDLGFSYHHIETSVFFNKTDGDKEFAINFFWAESNENRIQGLFALKRFDKIEKIIEEVTGNLDYTIRLPLTFDHLIHSNLPKSKPKSSIYLGCNDDIKEFSYIVKILYETMAIPFYKGFETLKDIENWMNENEIKDHSNLLVVSNNSMMIRKLMILKENGSADFKGLYSTYKSYLIDKSKGGVKVFQGMYNDFAKFMDYFESETV